MNLKKLVTKTLAIVGTVVIIDKVVNAVTSKGTKAISEAMLNEDLDNETSEDLEQYSFLDNDYAENFHTCDDNENNSEGFPNIKQYKSKDSNNCFEYAIKTKTTDSNPQEV